MVTKKHIFPVKLFLKKGYFFSKINISLSLENKMLMYFFFTLFKGRR